jgi:integrase
MSVNVKRVPIDRHPGFWRQGRSVVFKYRDRQRRQRWGSARTVAEAKKKRAALETDVARGEHRSLERVRFDVYARRWVESYQGRTRKVIEDSTRADYRRRLEEEAIPFFGGMLLSEVEPQDVKAYAQHVGARKRRPRPRKKAALPLVDRRPLSQNTVRLALAPVKALFATAFEEGLVRVNPAAGVRVAVPRLHVDVDEREEGEVKALRPAELELLLAKLTPPRWRLFFVVLVHLGLRIGEAIELRWSDVDLGGRTVKVRRKFYGGKVGRPKSRYGRRTLRLTPALAGELWRLRKQTRAGDDELVFTSATGMRIIPSNLMSRVLKKAARESGVGEWVGFHTFRHTCATLLFAEGWNPKQVQKWLGHHSAAFTVDTYVHLLDEDLPEPPLFAAAAAAGTSGVPSQAETTGDAGAAAAAGNGSFAGTPPAVSSPA